MGEDVSSNWRPIFLLEEEAALCLKDLTFRRNFQLISMKSKYCFWITFPNFVRKATWIPNCYSIRGFTVWSYLTVASSWNKTANVGLNLNSIGAKFKDVWWSNVPQRNVTVLIQESGDKKSFTCSQGKTLCWRYYTCTNLDLHLLIFDSFNFLSRDHECQPWHGGRWRSGLT